MPIRIIKKAHPRPPPVVPSKPESIKPPLQVFPNNCDALCRGACGLSVHSAVPWFMMASYLYYIHDVALLSDGLYDTLAQEMLVIFDQLDHQHMHLISKEALEAGSMYHLKATDYPLMTRGAACQLAKQEWGLSLDMYKDDGFDEASPV